MIFSWHAIVAGHYSRDMTFSWHAIVGGHDSRGMTLSWDTILADDILVGQYSCGVLFLVMYIEDPCHAPRAWHGWLASGVLFLVDSILGGWYSRETLLLWDTILATCHSREMLLLGDMILVGWHSRGIPFWQMIFYWHSIIVGCSRRTPLGQKKGGLKNTVYRTTTI